MSKDLGPIEIVGAEAIGPPGQRRFRLFAVIHNIANRGPGFPHSTPPGSACQLSS